MPNPTHYPANQPDTILSATKLAGQSIWSDSLSRAELRSGRLAELIAAGVTGVTSNPVIFEQAISKSDDYDNDIKKLVKDNPNLTPKQIYETLAIADIQAAADLLRPVYNHSKGLDGFVSLEVDPHLANDDYATEAEAISLFTRIHRPNVMIKIPASPAGIKAMARLAGMKIGGFYVNINMTLIFSLAQYQEILNGWSAGLRKNSDNIDPNLPPPQCVASFFMSRIDVLLDKEIAALMGNGQITQAQITAITPPRAPSIALAAAANAYQMWQKYGEFAPRLLWASTGNKIKNWPDTYYMENLIAKDTINTVPPATLAAFRDHGQIKPSQLNFAHLADNKCLQDWSLHGMTLERLGAKLLPDGIKIFAEAEDRLLAAIAAKSRSFVA